MYRTAEVISKLVSKDVHIRPVKPGSQVYHPVLGIGRVDTLNNIGLPEKVYFKKGCDITTLEENGLHAHQLRRVYVRFDDNHQEVPLNDLFWKSTRKQDLIDSTKSVTAFVHESNDEEYANILHTH